MTNATTSSAPQRVRCRARRSGSRHALACAAALAAALGLLAPAGAAAAPRRGPAAAKNAAKRNQARKLAQTAYDRFQAGDYERAEKLFLEAESLFHAPTHWLYIARARAKLGALMKAEEAYKEILDEDLPARAPKPFLEAQDSAKEEIEEVRRRIPKVTVHVTGAPQGATPEVTLDGEAITPDEAVRVEPGERVVRVTAPGARPAEQSVVVDEGESSEVAIHLEPVLAPKREGSVVPAAVAFGLGAVSLGVGAVTGVLSLNKVGDLEQTCSEKRCTPDQEPIADDARTLGTVSTIGFVAGGVLAGAGVVLFVVRPFGGGSGGDSGQGEAAVGPRMTAAAGPGSLIVRGTF